MGARRASTAAVVAVVGGVLLVTLLVAWAAAIGPGEVLRGDGPSAIRVADPTDEESPTEQPPGGTLNELEQRPPRDNDLVTALGVALQVLVVGGLLFLLYLGARAARDAWQLRRRPAPTPEDVEFDVMDAPGVLARELARGAVAQRQLLATGSPRNAIVEVWNRFEALAADAGATRRPWETSSEFTLKVLAAADADSTAVARLAALYREARFSDHELTEEHRAAAEAALATIHDGLAGAGRVVR